jgi:hypothetical protein
LVDTPQLRANLADGVMAARRTGIVAVIVVANTYRDGPWFRNEFWWDGNRRRNE